MIDEFNNITFEEKENEVFSLSELSSRLTDKSFKKRDAILTHYNELDKITEGFLGGELIILSAPTKSGKTTFCQSITLNMAEKGKSVLWFTLEMSWQELTRKFLQMSGENAELPIFYPIDNSKLCVTWIQELAEKAIKEKDIKMLIIDHLHFLIPLRDFHTNVSFLIGGIVRDIKKLAVSLNIPIILICHPGMVHEDEEMSWRNIRDSSFITQESDFTIVMHRVYRKEKDSKEKVATNEAKISVELNRRTGALGKVLLTHINGRFYDLNQMTGTSNIHTEEKIMIGDIEF